MDEAGQLCSVKKIKKKKKISMNKTYNLVFTLQSYIVQCLEMCKTIVFILFTKIYFSKIAISSYRVENRGLAISVLEKWNRVRFEQIWAAVQALNQFDNNNKQSEKQSVLLWERKNVQDQGKSDAFQIDKPSFHRWLP